MANSPAPLFERLGGETGVASLIDRFYARVTADPSLAPYFQNVPMDRVRSMQREFFSAALGGPLDYTGRPLNHVHAGRGISERAFSRFAEHLATTLEQAGVSEDDVRHVLGRLAPYAPDITGGTVVPD